MSKGKRGMNADVFQCLLLFVSRLTASPWEKLYTTIRMCGESKCALGMSTSPPKSSSAYGVTMEQSRMKSREVWTLSTKTYGWCRRNDRVCVCVCGFLQVTHKTHAQHSRLPGKRAEEQQQLSEVNVPFLPKGVSAVMGYYCILLRYTCSNHSSTGTAKTRVRTADMCGSQQASKILPN